MRKTSRTILFFGALLAMLAACVSADPAPTLIAAASATPVPRTASESPTLAPATPTPGDSPTPEEPIRFAVIGDYGLANTDAEAVSDLVYSWHVDFIVTTGDNNYPDGEAATIDENIGFYYHAYINNYQGDQGLGSQEPRFFPSIGNHDWNRGDGYEPYLEYFTLPGNERYYQVTQGAVNLFILNSDTNEPDGVGRSTTQAGWLRTALENSPTGWNLVIAHHPAYSSGYHTSNEWMQWPFAQWGADAVLAGHDHLYERLEVEGLPYITNGLGGHPAIYDFSRVLPESLVRYNEMHGAMLVEATSQWIRFEFINIDGTVVDSLLINN